MPGAVPEPAYGLNLKRWRQPASRTGDPENIMSQATVGRWGKNLAIRIPLDVAKRTGLVDGERVEIEAQDGEIVIRRTAAQARKAAATAAEEIITERQRYRLDRKALLRLIAGGRR
jgi:antitoxin component of MazEF toxin-antitoxin module